MWQGVEPSRGLYNETYIRVLIDIVKEATDHGIYTLLDLHQDLYSEKFCGEGMPAWAVDALNHSRFKFPEPARISPVKDYDKVGSCFLSRSFTLNDVPELRTLGFLRDRHAPHWAKARVLGSLSCISAKQ